MYMRSEGIKGIGFAGRGTKKWLFRKLSGTIKQAPWLYYPQESLYNQKTLYKKVCISFIIIQLLLFVYAGETLQVHFANTCTKRTNPMAVTIVLGISVLLQFVAAFLAFRLIRITGQRLAWVLIVAAISLMATRLSISLFRLISGDVSHIPDLSAELVALVISILMVAGIAWIAPLFLSIKRTKEALLKSEEKYRDFYDKAPDMYYSLSENKLIIDCNETTARMLGYKKEEIIGRAITDFFTKESRELFEETFPKLKQVKGYHNIEREFVRKDGTKMPVILNVFSEFGEDGNLIRTKTIARDITDRKKIEEELLKVEKLESLGVLAGGIAHDFNNLLTAILGSISLAKMYAGSGNKVSERLAEAEKASLQARDLTQKLLTFSKGGFPVKKAASISELIRDSAGFVLSGSNVRCEYSTPGNLWPVDVDEGQISQVINNLIINADQAMQQGGIIQVSCENVVLNKADLLPLKGGNYVKISIKDHGVGIPEKYIEKIFDPFFSTKLNGTGLGLSTVYSIIKRHNGYIAVESKKELGTTFYIYLPASRKDIQQKKDDTVIIGGKGKILVMDDEEIVREVLGAMLVSIGYGVEYATNGEEAVELYRVAKGSGAPFDAVILDLTIPGGMGGKKAIQGLLKIDPGVKAIVSSGYSNDPVMADFREYGFSGVAAKPYKIKQLSETVHNVIKGPV